MATRRRWWKSATATLKDKCSLTLARAGVGWYHKRGFVPNTALEVAIIKATSHNARAIDYKNASRVLAWVKISPRSSLVPLMWALTIRVERTRDWVVALKGLMLTHGILLCFDGLPSAKFVRCLPFDLSGFHDRSTEPGESLGFSTFVQAYFNFLDERSSLFEGSEKVEEDEEVMCLRNVQRMQNLLQLLMQIRPYGDGMETPLILEAMDCVIIEIFQVYGEICCEIAQSLTTIFSSPSSIRTKNAKGVVEVGILRRAREQSLQLSNYFQICRDLRVCNAARLPEIENITDEDINELEKLVIDDKILNEKENNIEDRTRGTVGSMTTVITKNWVMFKDDFENLRGSGGRGRYDRNPFLRTQSDLQQASRGSQ